MSAQVQRPLLFVLLAACSPFAAPAAANAETRASRSPTMLDVHMTLRVGGRRRRITGHIEGCSMSVGRFPAIFIAIRTISWYVHGKLLIYISLNS